MRGLEKSHQKPVQVIPIIKVLNENTNGLIRQYLPKSRELIDITKEETRDIMLRLNNRPRKRLEFKTPYEMFYNKNYKLTSSVALTS